MPNRVWGVRNAAKPYGRALSISMARWGWHQEAAAAQHKGSSSGAHTLLPMLPPVAAAATAPAVTNHTSGDKAAGGVTLPMLLGVAQQQRKAKEAGAEQACQPAVGEGLTLPMLPPVVATRPPHTSSSTSARQHSGSNHVCSAGSEFSSGLILVHHLQPPTAAKAAAAVNSAVQRAAMYTKHVHAQDAQDEDSADSVAEIKRQVWLYDAYDYEEVVRYAEQAADGIREAIPSSGCVTGCAEKCHGAATLCSEVCVDKCFDVSGWHTITAADEARGDATAAIPLPPTTWSVPAGAAAFVPAAATAVVPLAAPLCVKNTSWGSVAAAAAAARGKAARAMPAQQVKQGGLLVFPPVVLQRNATAACRGPQLLLPDIAAAAKSAGRSSRVSASSNNDNKQDARWVSSFLALPMLPPTRAAAASPHDHRGAVFAASAQGHIEKCVQNDAAHLQTPNNVTSDQNDMSFDDAVTQLWLSPVM